MARQLKREIARRKTLEEALAQSKRHHDRLLRHSRQMQNHLRQLSYDILSAQEDERKKISRDLHDQIAQTLIAVNVKIEILKKNATVNLVGLKKTLAGTQRLLDRSLDTVHRFAREMRPPLLDDLGLAPALLSYTKDFAKRASVVVHFTTFAGIESLAADKRTVLYRIAQEAMTNIAKHAKAARVDVTIKKIDGTVRLDIHDDGKAFRVERALLPGKRKRLGLLGMRERAEMVGGTLSIESAPGQGTTVRAELPFGRVRLRSSGPHSERSG